jgi:hypothetical protein
VSSSVAFCVCSDAEISGLGMGLDET